MSAPQRSAAGAGPLAGLTRATARDRLRLVAYAALPTVGLVSGPSYAAIVFATAALCFLHAGWFGGRATRVAAPFPALAVAFVALCGLSLIWSVVPGQTLSGTAQMTAILAGTLAFLAAPAGDRADGVFAVILAATAVGALLFCGDVLTGYPVQAWLSHRHDFAEMTKYNRGIDYLVVLSWPSVGYFIWRRSWWRAALSVALVGLVAGVGASLAGKVAMLAGLVTLGLAMLAPIFVGRALQTGTAVLIAIWPFLLRGMAVNRDALGGVLKPSAVHRLEIWDYMTADVLRHPLLGWGLLSSKSAPVAPAELAHFAYVHGPGIYPHDQWLQLWLELGLLGAAFGAVFVVVLVGAVRRLPHAVRPAAYGSIAAGLVIASVNFEFTTDSWWAAIGATGFLVIAFGRRVAECAGPGGAGPAPAFRSAGCERK